MKELAVDESLSGEARESAKKAVEVLTSSRLLEIEQTAALKKQKVELKKLESQGQFKRKKLEVEAREENLDQMAEWLAQHRLQNCAANIARLAGA